jgi:hypothetical protein
LLFIACLRLVYNGGSRSDGMAIHQSDPNRRPDDEYEPGELRHLVEGAEGRLLDARRTPVRIVELCGRTGQFTVEILAFEDVGARWTRPFEEIDRFQFERDGPRNDAVRVAEIEAIVRRFDQPLRLGCDPAMRAGTDRRLIGQTEHVRTWLRGHSTFLAGGGRLPDPEQRESDPRLWDDFRAYLDDRDLWDIEDAFATTFVSAPLGELIKGHRIVIAELGLTPYEGTIIRDEMIFDDPWSKSRRAEHIVARLAFIRALAAELGIESFTLYRGVSAPHPLRPTVNDTFVSASFSRAVAESLFDAYGRGSTGALIRCAVPIRRLFMTFLETVHMNRQYKEAEAVLLYESGESPF